MNILILGSTGMLGSAVGQHFLKANYGNVVLTYRDSKVAYGNLKVQFDPTQNGLTYLNKRLFEATNTTKFDYVINCIGTIKPFMASNPRDARYINSVFPWDLGKWCDERDSKLIHITTDCVFSGKKGKYTETDTHDALDDYGKSKSLGEPVTDAMVIRTSIIGEEIHKNASLVEWVKTQKGKDVNGFTKHFWNGITTKQYAKICDQIIAGDLWDQGLYHVHSANTLSKYEMLQTFNKRFDLDMKITEKETELCDRSLASTKDLQEKLCVPTVEEQIMSL